MARTSLWAQLLAVALILPGISAAGVASSLQCGQVVGTECSGSMNHEMFVVEQEMACE
jgi:hypothetical protein